MGVLAVETASAAVVAAVAVADAVVAAAVAVAVADAAAAVVVVVVVVAAAVVAAMGTLPALCKHEALLWPQPAPFGGLVVCLGAPPEG